jgi:phosphoribosyl 1,2-cyclic phosphodiesterase
MAFKICVLGSGSRGNCTLVMSSGRGLLIDAGLSAAETARRLAVVGVTVDMLDGVCVTHEHGDHTAGLKALQKKHGLLLYANSGTADAVNASGRCGELPWRIFATGQPFSLAAMNVQAFSVPHDSYDPVGYIVSDSVDRVGIATDIGMATTLVLERLKNCSAIVIEANHDKSMLNDSRRPWYLKQRIASRQGHMANQQTAELLAEIAHPGLKAIFLAHLSAECNTPETALAVIKKALAARGFPDIRLYLTYPDKPSEIVEVGAGAGEQ